MQFTQALDYVASKLQRAHTDLLLAIYNCPKTKNHH